MSRPPFCLLKLKLAIDDVDGSSSLQPRNGTMARAALLALVLCATCFAAARAAGDNTPFFADLLANARFGTPAKTTDYYATDYYSQTEVACLSQQDFKNCRLTECPGTNCVVNNFFLQ